MDIYDAPCLLIREGKNLEENCYDFATKSAHVRAICPFGDRVTYQFIRGVQQLEQGSYELTLVLLVDLPL